MAKTRSSQTAVPIPFLLVGSTTFGRYPFISVEQTFNMLIVNQDPGAPDAKQYLAPMAGYQYQIQLSNEGRGLFSSKQASAMFAASSGNLYEIGTSLNPAKIGELETIGGDVFIDQDILQNIAFCDGVNIYIYNYNTEQFYIAGTNPYSTGTVSQSTNVITGIGTTFTADMVGGTIYFADGTNAIVTGFTSATSLMVDTSATKSAQAYLLISLLDFIPNYVCFHDARFIATSSQSNDSQVGQWRLSKAILGEDGKTYIVFPIGTQFQGVFQTKADLPIAVVRMPGRSNVILIMGSVSSELWTDVGAALFPYQKNTSFGLDFGCVNPSTIATLETYVIWLGYNEKSGMVVMYTTGEDIKSISTDGIDIRFEQIQYPNSCYAFAVKLAGHILYIFTFYNPADNISLMYDFKTEKFFTLTDEKLNYFIGKRAVFFNNTYYMNSINDGNIYELNNKFTNYQYINPVVPGEIITQEIPRIRMCKTFRTSNSIPKVLNSLTFSIEQGVDTANTQTGSNVATIGVKQGGANYTVADVIITGDGTGAFATATIVNGVITSVSVVSPGIGYSWAVATIGGDGVGAELSLTLNTDNYLPRIDLAMSYDGGYTFGNFTNYQMFAVGKYASRVSFYELGYSNVFTPQVRFYGQSRFVVADGELDFFE
jgi:hypothetical protein